MKNNFSILYTYNKKLYHTVDSTRFSFWLVNSGYKWCIAFLFLTILYPVNAMASNYTYTMAFQAFLKWVPLLVKSGFDPFSSFPKTMHTNAYEALKCKRNAYEFNLYYSLPGNGIDSTETREWEDFFGGCLTVKN